MEARVRKWGNSLGIRIPQSIAEDIGISQDCAVSLEVEDGHLVVRPLEKKYTLEELLAKVTPDNIHNETDWGKRSVKKYGKTSVCPGSGRRDLAAF